MANAFGVSYLKGVPSTNPVTSSMLHGIFVFPILVRTSLGYHMPMNMMSSRSSESNILISLKYKWSMPFDIQK